MIYVRQPIMPGYSNRSNAAVYWLEFVFCIREVSDSYLGQGRAVAQAISR
jgi:hypothetical protein